MSRAIVMKSGGRSILVEVDESIEVPNDLAEAVEGVPAGMDAVVGNRSLEREFAEIKSLISTVCNGLFEAIAEIPSPQEVVAEFGIKLGGESAVPLIAKATVEGNFQISIKWVRDKSPDSIAE